MESIKNYCKYIYCSATVLTILLFAFASLLFIKGFIPFSIVSASGLIAATVAFALSRSIEPESIKKIFEKEAVTIFLFGIVMVAIYLSI